MKRRARARASPKIAKRIIIIGSCETRLLNPGENGYSCARYLLIRASLKSQLVSSRIRDNCVLTAKRDNLCVLSIEFDRGYLSFSFISFIFIIFYFFFLSSYLSLLTRRDFLTGRYSVFMVS